MPVIHSCLAGSLLTALRQHALGRVTHSRPGLLPKYGQRNVEAVHGVRPSCSEAQDSLLTASLRNVAPCDVSPSRLKPRPRTGTESDPTSASVRHPPALQCIFAGDTRWTMALSLDSGRIHARFWQKRRCLEGLEAGNLRSLHRPCVLAVACSGAAHGS